MRSTATVRNLFKTLVAKGIITEAGDVRRSTVLFCLGGIVAAAFITPMCLLWVPTAPTAFQCIMLVVYCIVGGFMGAAYGSTLPYEHPDRQALASAIFTKLPGLERYFDPNNEQLDDAWGRPSYKSTNRFASVMKLVIMGHLDEVQAVVEDFGPSRCWRIK